MIAELTCGGYKRRLTQNGQWCESRTDLSRETLPLSLLIG